MVLTLLTKASRQVAGILLGVKSHFREQRYLQELLVLVLADGNLITVNCLVRKCSPGSRPVTATLQGGHTSYVMRAWVSPSAV